ncbi:MAG: DUF4286 domain-containing protein [Phototrophicales bacterium]|nr:MAG: DUF4286 domain-containing protein [Phototrophicales bacterium]
MIVYNVTVKIDAQMHDEWLAWMKAVHIPAVLDTGFFFDHKMYRLMELNEADGITYAIQYFCDSFENYMQYQKEVAPALQQAHTDKYKDKFVAFRTLMRAV